MHRTLGSSKGIGLLAFAVAVAVAPTIALSGCTGWGQPPPVARTAAPSPSDGSPATTPSSAGDPLGNAFAERTATVDGTAMRLEMFPIRRSDAVATMTARLTIERAAASPRPFFYPLSRTQNIQDPIPAGFTLVAQQEGRAYLPAEDSDKHPLCTPTIDDVEVGDVIIVSCLFGVPAPSTSTVDVQVVNFGNYHDVPLV